MVDGDWERSEEVASRAPVPTPLRMDKPEERPSTWRSWITRGYTLVEDVVYIGLGLILAALVLAVLVSAGTDLVNEAGRLGSVGTVIGLLDRVLLALLVVELLYTVQVSFREHALHPEPFILVGLISAIRRVLLLTAQIGEEHQGQPPLPAGSAGSGGPGVPAAPSVIELAVLSGLILALAVALYLLRRSGRVPVKRA